jgi:RHS repeat-associated protein
VDINGDGLPDWVTRPYSPPFNHFNVRTNTGSGFGPVQSWSVTNETSDGTASWNTINSSIQNLGNQSDLTELVDINGDGLPDRVMRQHDLNGNSTYDHFQIQTNSGTGFKPVFDMTGVTNQNANFSSSVLSVPSVTIAGGVYTLAILADMNGDGLPDRVMQGGTDGTFDVQLNHRSSFSSIVHWGSVNGAAGISGNNAYAPRSRNYYDVLSELMDMNGDGLPDRLIQGGVQLNNGANGFATLQSWGYGSTEDPETVDVTDGCYIKQLIDINGDGLPDLVYSSGDGNYYAWFNTGNGFSSDYVVWSGVNTTGDGTTGWGDLQAWNTYGTKVTFIDMNGDGLLDRVMREVSLTGGADNLRVQLNSGPFPDLLTGVDNGMGGTVAVTYTNAAHWNNSDGTRSRLSLPLYTVTSVTVGDGIRNWGTTTYSYQGGLYDTTWREFRGFAEVMETDPMGTVTWSYFHQGGGLNSSAYGEYQDSRFKTGMPWDIQTYDSDGQFYKETFNIVDQVRVDANGVYFPYVADSFTFDAEPYVTPRATLKQYTYAVTQDNLAASTGNLLQEADFGEVTNVNTDAYGNTTYNDVPDAPVYSTYTYATLSNPNIIDKPASVTVSGDAAGYNVLRKTLCQYFGATGNLQEKSELVCPSTYANTFYTYDSYWNPATVTDPMGIVTTMNYDSASATFLSHKYTGTLTNGFQSDPRTGSLLFSTNEQGLVTGNTYDGLLRLTNSAISTAPNGAPTLWRKQYSYNLGGMNGSGTVSHNYVYARQNDPAASTGYHESYTYLDGLGRAIQAWDQSETGGYRMANIFYDERGSVQAQSFPVFASDATSYVMSSGTPQITYTLYDPIGRPDTFYPCATAVFDSFGDFLGGNSLDGDTGSPVGPTYISYSDGNNPWAVVVTDARDKTRKYLLDAFGRTNQIVEVTSGGNYTTTLGYNQVGDLTNITDNALNNIAMFYDLTGNRVAMADPDMGFWQYNYDLDGRLKTQTDAKGQQTKLYYDSTTGRLIRREGWSATGQCLSTNTWTYDSNSGDTAYTNYPGQLYKVTDDQGWQKYGYDVRNRTLKSVRYLTKNGNTYTNQFTFDNADRLTSTLYPNGGPTITNVFDNGGGHLLKVASGTTNYYTATGFNALNQLTGITFGNGVGTTLNYYSVSKRLQQIVSAKSGNLQNLTYGYDAVGNITNIADGVYSGAASGVFGKIQYDDLNRLTSLTNAGGTFTYGYNSIGNVLTNKESGNSNYVYGTIRPHCVRSANGMWFTYDQNGNVVFRSRQRLDYDVNNRLYRVINTNGTVVTFGYDANGSRLWESSGTNALQVWIGGNYEEKQGLTLYHIYAGDRLVATFDKTKTNLFQYYHPDDLTSTSIQTDTNGAVIQHYEYSAFGQSRYTQNTNTTKVSRRFTSQILDDGTGLYFFNSRYYDPILIRWIQGDTIIPDLSNPQSYNRYSYCGNNPLRYTDPSGHTWVLFDKQAWSALPGWFVNDVLIGDTSVRQEPSSYQSLMANSGTPLLTPLTDAKGNKLGNPASAVGAAVISGLGQAAAMATPMGEEKALGAAAKEGEGILKATGKEAANASKIDRAAFRGEREAFWKAEAKNNSGKYSPENLERMKQGKAPIGSDGYSTELHHVDRTPEGGVQPMTRTEHRLGDNYKKNHPPVENEPK